PISRPPTPTLFPYTTLFRSFTGGRERTPKNILRDYTDLTGRTPLPPLWALGNQQSRWAYSPESRVREVARGFRESKIPADVIYLDRKSTRLNSSHRTISYAV